MSSPSRKIQKHPREAKFQLKKFKVPRLGITGFGTDICSYLNTLLAPASLVRWYLVNRLGSYSNQFIRAYTSLFTEERCERTPEGVQFIVFPFYIILANENCGFKNTNVNRPFSKCRKPLLPGWLVGQAGGGDKQAPFIFLKIEDSNENGVLIQNAALKVLYRNDQKF